MSELQTMRTAPADEISLYWLLRTLWSGRLVIITCTMAVAAAFALYAWLATETYRAQASVQIREDSRSNLPSQVGSLAALAGISIGAQDDSRELALAALKTRAVIQRMIEEEQLLPVLYAEEWDEANGRWRTPDPPTPWKAYERFTRRVLSVSEDRRSGIVTIAMEWKDPVLAAAWVDTLIKRVNTFVNDATIREAEQNLKFLDQQAQSTSVVELQKTIFSMMEGEIKRMMVARNPETAPLRVIDPPVVPERRARPRRAMIGILGILCGGLLGGLIVLGRSTMKE